MLAELGNLHPLRWLARLAPPFGYRYELFDTSLMLGLIACVNYALTTPPAETQQALHVTLPFVTDMQMGVAVTAACVVGLVCSYRDQWTRFGYFAVIAGAAVMGWFIFGGALVTPFPRTFVSAVLFLNFASRLLRELARRKKCLALGRDE